MKESSIQLLALILLSTAPLTSAAAEPEPNVEVASGWWGELTNIATPVGWRDHPHRFCTLFDGTIFAIPKPERILGFERNQTPWPEGVQLGFAPSHDGVIPPEKAEQYSIAMLDGSHVGDQGWADHPAPVLWTRWRPTDGPLAGLELRQTNFAHMAGGGEAQTGTEPMFLWIRLEVTARDESAAADRCGFLVQVNAPHTIFQMNEGDNLRAKPEKHGRYPSALRYKTMEDFEAGGGIVVEENGAVRMIVLPPAGGSATFTPKAEGKFNDYLYVTMPATAGAHVDLLLPMIPATDGAALRDELALGYDGALEQADAFWSIRPDTAATIHTPEPLINDAIASSVRFARLMTTTVPETRQRAMLSGAIFYSYVWVTPTSMTKHMLLDPMGWHDDVGKYLEIYPAEQGRITAPGPDFRPHPGYFGAPEAFDSGNRWITDHGAVLYTASRHALLSGDEQFIQRWLEPILKACDFIKEARRLPRNPPAVEGVLPPAEASDVSQPFQAFWSDGWNYKALVTAARLLRVIGHPRAAELEQEAAEYRTAIVAAFRAKTATMPKWTDRAGSHRPIVPMSLTMDEGNGLGTEHPFYLDTGPLFGVFAGVLPADDELMLSAVEFFRQGPHVPADADAPRAWSERPYLRHEISSAEPCYSWNVYHSHRLADRHRYFEGMYSLFAGALSRQTHISCETRGGVAENVFASTLAVNLARLAAVDDEVEAGSLHLMRLVPLAWLSQDEQTRYENMPTEFGPVTLKWHLAQGGKALEVIYEPRFRRQPESVTLHVPPLEGLERVIINGQEHKVAGPDAQIQL